MKLNKKIMWLTSFIVITIFIIIAIFSINKKHLHNSKINILEHMEDWFNDPAILELYKEEIDTINRNLLTIKYYDIDLNDDGRKDKIVIMRYPFHTGSQGDSFRILINDGNSYYELKNWFTLRLYSQNNWELALGSVYISNNIKNGFHEIEIHILENQFILRYENGRYECFN